MHTIQLANFQRRYSIGCVMEYKVIDLSDFQAHIFRRQLPFVSQSMVMRAGSTSARFSTASAIKRWDGSRPLDICRTQSFDVLSRLPFQLLHIITLWQPTSVAIGKLSKRLYVKPLAIFTIALTNRHWRWKLAVLQCTPTTGKWRNTWQKRKGNAG